MFSPLVYWNYIRDTINIREVFFLNSFYYNIIVIDAGAQESRSTGWSRRWSMRMRSAVAMTICPVCATGVGERKRFRLQYRFSGKTTITEWKVGWSDRHARGVHTCYYTEGDDVQRHRSTLSPNCQINEIYQFAMVSSDPRVVFSAVMVFFFWRKKEKRSWT